MAEDIEDSLGEGAEEDEFEARALSLGLAKAVTLERGIAKLVDFLIVGALFTIPTVVGPAAGITYLLISDGLRFGGGGRSLGKLLVGLRVVSLAREGGAADFRESLLRNSEFAVLLVAYLLIGWVPYIGPFVVLLISIAAVAYEAMLVTNDEFGIRFGDKIASTMVVAAR